MSAKSTYEAHGDWEKRTFCDNASKRGRGVGVKPQCHSGKREYTCTVKHNDGPFGSETMVLCSECREQLRKGARKHHYNFTSKKVN